MSLKRDLKRETTKEGSSPFRRSEFMLSNTSSSKYMLASSTHTSPKTASIPTSITNIQETPPFMDKDRRISSLQEEFENLKKKIKDVENKNERIIEKIHVSQHIDQRIPQYTRRYTTEEITAHDQKEVNAPNNHLASSSITKSKRNNSK